MSIGGGSGLGHSDHWTFTRREESRIVYRELPRRCPDRRGRAYIRQVRVEVQAAPRFVTRRLEWLRIMTTGFALAFNQSSTHDL